MDNRQYQDELLDVIDIMLEERLRGLDYSYNKVGIVTSVDSVNNLYTVNMDGEYFSMGARIGLVVAERDIVYVSISNKDFTDKFIDRVLGQSNGVGTWIEGIEELQDKISDLVASTQIDEAQLNEEINTVRTSATNLSDSANNLKEYINTALIDSVITGSEGPSIDSLKAIMGTSYHDFVSLSNSITSNALVDSASRMDVEGILPDLLAYRDSIFIKVSSVQNGTHTETTQSEINSEIQIFIDSVITIKNKLEGILLAIANTSIAKLKEYMNTDFKNGIFTDNEKVVFGKLLDQYILELNILQTLVENLYTDVENDGYYDMMLELDGVSALLTSLEVLKLDIAQGGAFDLNDKELLDNCFYKIRNLEKYIDIYIKYDTEKTKQVLSDLSNEVSDALSDSYITNIEANNIKLSFDKAKAESDGLVLDATNLGITIERDIYRNVYDPAVEGSLAQEISKWVLRSDYPVAITPLERTALMDKFSDAENKRLALVNKMTEIRGINITEDIKNWKVDILSSNGSIFKNGDISTILEARVYKGDEDITDTLDASRFKWTRVSSDAIGDQYWNTTHFGGAKQVTITSDDVFVRATFNCVLSEE